jgi:uncharacterized protein involved in propanediol utilization
VHEGETERRGFTSSAMTTLGTTGTVFRTTLASPAVARLCLTAEATSTTGWLQPAGIYDYNNPSNWQGGGLSQPTARR